MMDGGRSTSRTSLTAALQAPESYRLDTMLPSSERQARIKKRFPLNTAKLVSIQRNPPLTY